MELKPLLEEKEEKIVFAEDNKLTVTKKGKNNKEKNGFAKSLLNKSVIITVILTFGVVYFFGRTLYGFYLGFEYFDLRYASSTPTPVANSNTTDEDTTNNDDILEEVPLSSAILNNTYNKINLSNCDNLLSRFYANGITVNDLTNEEKLGLVINSLNLVTDTGVYSLSSGELNNAFINLFNDSSLINSFRVAGISNYGTYSVNYDATADMFIISGLNNNTCANNFLVKNITRATSDDENLYIYEMFGYFKYINDNNYEVYDSPLESNLLTTYTDVDGTRNFTNNDFLATYMWTYKKGSDNNYYFVSITHL